MLVTTFLFLYVIHILAEKTLHYYFKDEYKNIIPVFKHSLIYSLIFILPSFWIFSDPTVVWYFIMLIFFLHYSVNYLFFHLFYYINENNRGIVLEADTLFHLAALYYSYWFFINAT